jgi:hypothetical protein
MFCVLGIVFDGTEGIESRFHVLRSRTRFFAERIASGPVFFFFACTVSFSAVLRVRGPIFLFCAPRVVSRGIEGVGSLFHVLRVFGYTKGVMPVFMFYDPDSFSVVPKASGPVFLICAPGLNFSDSEGVGSRYLALCARTHFQRYRGRLVLFSCFTLPDMFSTVPRASGSIFMFCPLEHVFDNTEGVGSHFHVCAL